MKKFLNIIVLLCALLLCASCTSKVKESTNSGKIKVVTTIFPLYDFARNIIGDNEKFEIKMLIKNGIDMHSFNPSAADLKDIAECDVFIFVGGESDEWAKKVVKSDLNKKMNAVNLMDALPEILVEEDSDEGEEHEHNGEMEFDEHIWLSLSNANAIVKLIKNSFIACDPGDKANFDANAKAYLLQINDLEVRYAEVCTLDGQKVMVFADRFPFKYLCDDYHILYFAAFKGCSAESEASFEKVMSLAKKVDEYKLKHIFTLEGNNKKLANTVIENTKDKDAKILELDSMQSVTTKDVENGATYLDIMKENLEVLKVAFKN